MLVYRPGRDVPIGRDSRIVSRPGRRMRINGRKVIFKGEAVNLPDGEEKAPDDGPDNESDPSEHEESTESAEQDEKVGHLRVVTDKLRAEHVVHGTHYPGGKDVSMKRGTRDRKNG